RAADQHQVQAARRMIEEEPDGITDSLIRDHMIVIQNQDEIPGGALKIVKQRRQDGREWERLGGMQQGERSLSKSGAALAQCRNDPIPEADRIIVQFLKGKPGHCLVGSLCPSAVCLRLLECYPCREQRGLATASSSRDKRERVRAHGSQICKQASALHQGVRQARWRELTGKQHSPRLG